MDFAEVICSIADNLIGIGLTQLSAKSCMMARLIFEQGHQ